MKALRIVSENLETTSEFCPWCGVDDGAHGLVHSRIGFFSTSKVSNWWYPWTVSYRSAP